MARPLHVVGVGAGSASRSVLSWAIAEAGAAGADLLMCRAVVGESPLARPGVADRMATLDLADPGLARALAAARARLGAARVALAVSTQPAPALLLARASAADLLVVGAPGQHEPGAYQQQEPGGPQQREPGGPGAIIESIISRAFCPVVAVRIPAPSQRAGSGRSPGPFAGHVVVGVDGTASSRAAVEFGFGFADTHRLPVAAVHVAAHTDHDLYVDDRFRETHLFEEPEAMVLLATEVEAWERKYPTVTVKRALVSGAPDDGLSGVSAGAKLLAIGCGHVARGDELGSVTLSLVHGAPCTVAITRGDGGTEMW
jgi:nucleotide-binding universal stress UspA family protein